MTTREGLAHLPSLRVALAGGQGQWGRQLMAVLAIALGTALGVAVNLINGAAVDEFAAAANQFGGAADLSVSAGRDGFSDAVYPLVAALPSVEVANPVVDVTVLMRCHPGKAQGTRLLGLDVLQAGRIDPTAQPPAALARALLNPGQAAISQAAAAALACTTGDRLTLQTADQTQIVTIAGLLPDDGSGRSFLLLDIGNAQEMAGMTGRLQRIDVRLRAGVTPGAVQAALRTALPAGVQVTPPGATGTRTATLSRAYRANLTVLALIALFTGGFLVFTTQTLAVARRHGRIGLMRALGVERRQVLLAIALEGGQVGLAGSILGIALGTAVAAWALARFGGDLGAGYFSGSRAHFQLDPLVLLAFLLLGTGCALAGCLLPAWQAAQTDPALALHGGRTERQGRSVGLWLGGVMLLAGALLCQAPPVLGLPLPGYLAIALLLVGLLTLLPQLTGSILRRLPTPAGVLPGLALAGLRARSRDAALSLATIVVAVSLVAAMLVMIGSFRLSLAQWLDQVLPADLYLRGSGGLAGQLTPAASDRLAAIPGVAAVDTLRSRPVLLRADLPAVSLISRNLAIAWQHHAIAVVEGANPAGQGSAPTCAKPCAWISEAMVDLYGLHPGSALRLPLDGHWLDLQVAGVWRDYARQFGAVVIDRADYQRITADPLADDASVYLAPGVDAAAVAAAVQRTLGEDRFEVAEPTRIKTVSLQVFDRSFTVTYALEGVALLIGLLGISAGFGAQILARRREFGVLVHLGATRQQIRYLVLWEGALVSAIGIGIGVASGIGIGLILIHVINRQSFHWSMETHLPWTSLAALGLLMQVAASLAAVLSAREGTGPEALLAVRDDA